MSVIRRRRVIVLSRTGRASLPDAVWVRLEQAADVSVVTCEGAPSPAEAVALRRRPTSSPPRTGAYR